MGTFSGMAGAKRGFVSNPLKDGDYVVRIDKCSHFEAKQTGEKFKVDVTILAVNRGSMKEGEVASVTYSKQHGLDLFLGNIKGFIAGVMNVPDDAVGENETLQCLEPQNILAGTVARVRADARASKKKDERGENFSYQVYTWHPSLDKAEIEKALGPDRVKKHFPNGL